MRFKNCTVLFMASSLAGLCVVLGDTSLIERNPFVWSDFNPNPSSGSQQARPSNQGFEFHAVYELSGQTQVLVRDRANNKYHWLEVGTEMDGLLAKSFNPDSNQLVFAYENDEQFLDLEDQPLVTSAPLASAAGPAPAAVQSSPRTTGTSAVSPGRRVIRPSSRPTPTTSRPSVTTRRGPPAPTGSVLSRRTTSSPQVQPSQKDLERFRNFDIPRPQSTEVPSLGDLAPPDMILPPGIND